MIVTSPHTGEVNALVGGRRTDFEGFNRALDARRPIGSLIKPAVYLAALESGRYDLSTIVDDSPIEVKLENGTTWTPSNFDNDANGPVPLVRALKGEVVRDGAGVLHVAATAASCDDEGEHPACHVSQQDWGIPVRLEPGAPAELRLVLRG